MNIKKLFLILFLAVTSFFVWSFSIPQEEKINFSERVKISLREVGNQLLLSNKDSVSLILPVTKISDFKYRVSFENELTFEPNTLVKIVKKVFKKTSFSENYRVEVLQVEDNEVAYSYEINVDEEKTIIPCAGRVLPEKKYVIEVSFLDKKSILSSNNWVFYGLFLTLILVLYLLFSKPKKVEKSEVLNNEKTIVLGVFQFYPHQNKLMKKATEIGLSKKECELLEIFVANKNKVVKREELTKKVWEDNGVFVGRSLDTYISKLRKKLKEDTTIKLTNVHGVGYKLEVTL